MSIFNTILAAAGSSGGLEYEEGTFTLSSNSVPTVTFGNTHTNPPAYISVSAMDSVSYASNGNVTSWEYVDYERLTGYPVIYYTGSSTSVTAYVRIIHMRQTTSLGMQNLSYSSTDTTSSSSSYPRYYATPTQFYAHPGYIGVNYRAGIQYHWTAIWVD